MTDEEKKTQCINVSKAAQSYRNFVETGVDPAFKESKVGTWLISHSNFMFKERKIEKGKYISCKEGSLIYCDFGINPGAEISGWHFAITLNKDDNSFNPILTVIPLTSKNRPSYLDIGNEVYDRTINAISDEINTFAIESEKISNALSLISKAKVVNDDPNSSSTDKETFYVQAIKFILHLCDIDITDMPDSDTLSVAIDESIEKFSKMVSEYRTSLKELNTIKEKYERYKGNTYAAILQITTISKLRLSVRMNKFDPIATIQVSHDALTKIKTDLIERFA